MATRSNSTGPRPTTTRYRLAHTRVKILPGGDCSIVPYDAATVDTGTVSQATEAAPTQVTPRIDHAVPLVRTSAWAGLDVPIPALDTPRTSHTLLRQ